MPQERDWDGSSDDEEYLPGSIPTGAAAALDDDVAQQQQQQQEKEVLALSAEHAACHSTPRLQLLCGAEQKNTLQQCLQGIVKPKQQAASQHPPHARQLQLQQQQQQQQQQQAASAIKEGPSGKHLAGRHRGQGGSSRTGSPVLTQQEQPQQTDSSAGSQPSSPRAGGYTFGPGFGRLASSRGKQGGPSQAERGPAGHAGTSNSLHRSKHYRSGTQDLKAKMEQGGMSAAGRHGQGVQQHALDGGRKSGRGNAGPVRAPSPLANRLWQEQQQQQEQQQTSKDKQKQKQQQNQQDLGHAQLRPTQASRLSQPLVSKHKELMRSQDNSHNTSNPRAGEHSGMSGACTTLGSFTSPAVVSQSQQGSRQVQAPRGLQQPQGMQYNAAAAGTGRSAVHHLQQQQQLMVSGPAAAASGGVAAGKCDHGCANQQSVQQQQQQQWQGKAGARLQLNGTEPCQKGPAEVGQKAGNTKLVSGGKGKRKDGMQTLPAAAAAGGQAAVAVENCSMGIPQTGRSGVVEDVDGGVPVSEEMTAALYAALMPEGATEGTSTSAAAADLAGALAAWATGQMLALEQLQPGEAVADSEAGDSRSSAGQAATEEAEDGPGALGVQGLQEQLDQASDEGEGVASHGDDVLLGRGASARGPIGLAHPSFGRWNSSEVAGEDPIAAEGAGGGGLQQAIPTLLLRNISKGMGMLDCLASSLCHLLRCSNGGK